MDNYAGIFYRRVNHVQTGLKKAPSDKNQTKARNSGTFIYHD
jgi:hypothetical protein